MKNQQLLHAIKYCVIYIKYCILYVLYCVVILEKRLDFMHSVASRFGYSKYQLSELSLVPISSDNRRTIVFNSVFMIS